MEDVSALERILIVYRIARLQREFIAPVYDVLGHKKSIVYITK